MSYSMRVEPRNFRRTWNILVVVFLNCSCEINFRAPSRLQGIEKVSWLEKKYSTVIPSFFLTQQKIKKVNKQSSSMTISRFDADRIWHGQHINDFITDPAIGPYTRMKRIGFSEKNLTRLVKIKSDEFVTELLILKYEATQSYMYIFLKSLNLKYIKFHIDLTFWYST